MEINYKNNALEKVCTRMKDARKKYGNLVAEKIIATINFIESSENLYDVIAYPPFHFHDLKGDHKGLFSIYLGKNTGYRLIVIPLDDKHNNIKGDNWYSKCKEIRVIKVMEVSKHYE